MRTTSRYIDLAFCLVILPLMIFVFPVERWWGTEPLFFSAFVAWLYVCYFTYRYVIMPGLFHGGRRRACAVAVLALSLAVTFLFSTYEISSPFYCLRARQQLSIPYPMWGLRQNQQAVWLHYIIVATFCVTIGTLTEAYRQRLAREAVEHERNKAELALYKAQINPHFLFNTLNTIYGLLITHSDKTEVTLERFINLTKYLYNNAGHDFIPLEEEADYIGQYIALQELRLNEFAQVSYVRDIGDGSRPVPPMMLITFVENAFKYGISSSTPCFVRIHLRQAGATIRFTVENSVFDQPATNSRRMGIENCRRRLSLLYPGHHRLDIQRGKDNVFRVVLELKTPDHA